MVTHEVLAKQATQALASVDPQAIVSAFVASLSSRNLPARSALGSYVVLQHFAKHDFVKSDAFAGDNCAYCGLPRECDAVDMEERVKCYPYQVRHPELQYATYDLATFGSRVFGAPDDEDREQLRAIFHAIRALPATAQLGGLSKSLQGVIKSNKHERMILLETLGYAGILCPDDQRNYSEDFVPYDFTNQAQPSQFYKREWAYPVRFWMGADGVNEKWMEYYFGDFL